MTLLMLAVLAACGGRMPSAKSAHSMTAGFFKSYGKKYKTSIIGQNPVQKVEINGVSEQARNLSEIDAFLQLGNGQMARVLLTAKKTPPLGWDILSWEMLELR